MDPGDPEFGNWEPDSLAKTGGANVWSLLSVDQDRDLVFLPTASASPNFYGGTRPGDNRYANSLVALRGSTGEVVWHFQTIHHDVWDWDLPAQPILVDVTRDGQKIPVVVQLTKPGMVFVFHRETGEPFFPIGRAVGTHRWRTGRRAVTDAAIPGEATAADENRNHTGTMHGE